MDRNDAHRPSVIQPEDYTFVAFDYVGPDHFEMLALRHEREVFLAHRSSTDGRYSNHEHGGTCHVCGAVAFYMIIWHNAKLNQYIQTGEDCAQKMDMSYGDLNAFRRQFADAREARAGKAKAQAILADNGLSRAWDFGPDAPAANWKYEEITINDIVNKLVKYGSVSDKQFAFVRILLAKIDNRAAVAAQKAAEQASYADCPSGRLKITGTVLGMKEVENPFAGRWGNSTKWNVLIQSVDGFKVYGSRFANIEKAQQVTFVSTIEPSKTDSKFGFFKRPLVFVDKDLEKFLSTVAWG